MRRWLTRGILRNWFHPDEQAVKFGFGFIRTKRGRVFVQDENTIKGQERYFKAMPDARYDLLRVWNGTKSGELWFVPREGKKA